MKGHIFMANEKEKTPKKVKLKILVHTGHFTPGQIVEVSEEDAKELLRVGQVNWGDKLIPHVRAITLDQAKKLDKIENDPENLTVAQIKEKEEAAKKAALDGAAKADAQIKEKEEAAKKAALDEAAKADAPNDENKSNDLLT
jgi:hypothetical protein